MIDAGTDVSSVTDLDDLDLERADPGGMLATVEATGEQWRAAVELAREVGDPRHARITAAVICGMGGSGIAADVARAAAFHHGTGIPVVPVKGYALPSWIGERTLVIAVSYSGDTEETRACLEQARQARAQIAVVTSGGWIGSVAEERNWALVTVPGGGQPRANLPYLAAPVLGLLEAAGVLDGVVASLADVGAHVQEASEAWHHEVPTERNRVKQAARALDGLAPVFYAASGFPALVAQRAKCQVNENAKRPAFHHELPELDHNEVVGWQALPEVTAGMGLVVLRDPHEHAQVAKRVDVTLDLIGAAFATTLTHELQGGALLHRFAEGVLFVDLLSVYLALLEGVDPTPVDRITELKRRIAT